MGDADGANARRVFDCVSPCLEAEEPAWSSDGRMLAFVTWGPQPASLAVLDLATGTISLILTVDHDPDAFRRPRWSQDGHRIVLEHQTWTGGEDDQIADSVIGIVDLDSASPQFTPITEPAMWATYPDWHPTEDRIVFSTRPWSELGDGPSNLYTIRPDGSGMTTLTGFVRARAAPSSRTWTPDGKQIVFTKVEGAGFGNPTMAVIDADGRGLRSATASGGSSAPTRGFARHPEGHPAPRCRTGGGRTQDVFAGLIAMSTGVHLGVTNVRRGTARTRGQEERRTGRGERSSASHTDFSVQPIANRGSSPPRARLRSAVLAW